MKKLTVLPVLFSFFMCFGQNVHMEIADYDKKLDEKLYTTYQFVEASYSYSRPQIVLITSKAILSDVYLKIPNLFTRKQEYSDVWILGIDQFNKNSVSEVDKKIIDTFFHKIMKYRSNNDLPPYSLKELNETKIFLEDSRDLCKYIICDQLPK
jgi:hypothetical protein